jgi:hypothetical protein
MKSTVHRRLNFVVVLLISPCPVPASHFFKSPREQRANSSAAVGPRSLNDDTCLENELLAREPIVCSDINGSPNHTRQFFRYIVHLHGSMLQCIGMRLDFGISLFTARIYQIQSKVTFLLTPSITREFHPTSKTSTRY